MKKMTNTIEVQQHADKEQWIVDRSHKHDREGVQIWQGDMLIADVLDDQHGNAEIHAQQIIADHNNAADYQASLTRLTAQRNRYWEQVEVLVEALREVAIRSLRYCEEKYGHDDQARLNLEAALAAVAEESENSD